jgi:hypothetical protein
MVTLRRSIAALAAALALAAGTARAGGIEVSFDRELAFEWDRAHYEQLLREHVERAERDVTAWLGMERRRPLRVQVVTKERYERQFGTDAVWTQGARYAGGAILVNGANRLGDGFGGLMAHEMVHAVLDDGGTAWALPSWLNEGLAMRVGYRRQGQEALTFSQINRLEDALEHKLLLPLPVRGPPSAFGYEQAFAAVLFLEQKLGKEQLLRLVRRTLKERSFERALDAEQRWTVRDLEEGFRYWVDHLQ